MPIFNDNFDKGDGELNVHDPFKELKKMEEEILNPPDPQSALDKAMLELNERIKQMKQDVPLEIRNGEWVVPEWYLYLTPLHRTHCEHEMEIGKYCNLCQEVVS